MFTVLIIIISLVILIFLHELGHFLVAKKYGVKVEEFGIGIPPRLYGKKIGETLYSINWIPLGGFVRLYGEDRDIKDDRSFSQKPIYQRALIVFAGVAAFFVIAFVVFSIHSMVGVRTIAEDGKPREEMNNPEVFVTGVLSESPAEDAGIKSGDVLLKIDGEDVDYPSNAISMLRDKKGEEVNVLINRGKEDVSMILFPREDDSLEGGVVGFSMVMTEEKVYPFYKAPVQGVIRTGEMTFTVFYGFYSLFNSFVTGTPLPLGMEIGGPVAVVDIGASAFSRGISDFLQFLGAITVSLAVINILPIPALDGGRLAFLLIEKIKGTPLPQKIEYGLNATFFLLLMGLMIFITFKDLGL